MSSLPSKLFFRIGEVAGLVGVEPHVLRYWEREFRSIRPTKSAKGQRVYSRKDVENLLRVRDLLYRDGFTIAGAKKRLVRGGAEPEDGVSRAELQDDEALDAGGEEVEGDEASAEPASVSAETPSVLAVEPRSAPLAGASSAAAPAGPAGPPSRAKLSALRAEVEAFLDELEPLARAERGERA